MNPFIPIKSALRINQRLILGGVTIGARCECHVVIFGHIAVSKGINSSVLIGNYGGSSGVLVKCVRCGRHIDDGAMCLSVR